jgi:hypothetical protein
MPLNYLPLNGEIDHSNFFFKYKRSNETLGITTLKREELFDEENEYNKVEFFITSFFNYGINFDEMNYKYHLEPTKNPYLYKIAGYPVTCSLTKKYLDNNKNFDSPLSCKWHPTNNQWIIHPGRTRCRVLQYFLEDDIDAYVFNTQGLTDPPFIHIFNNKKEITEYVSHKINRPATIYLYCSAYYGSLLPDIYLDQDPGIITDDFVHVSSFFRRTKINANFDLGMFEYQENNILKSPQSEVDVYVNHNDYDSIIRAMMLLPYHSNYESNDISIKTHS